MFLIKSKQLIFQALQAQDICCNYLILLLERENSLRQYVKPTDVAGFQQDHIHENQWPPDLAPGGALYQPVIQTIRISWEGACVPLATQGPSFEFLDIAKNTSVAQVWHIVGPWSRPTERMRTASLGLHFPPGYIVLYFTKRITVYFASVNFLFCFCFVSF